MTTTIVRPTLHHVTFKTKRLDAMVDWYGKAVGMEPNFKFEGGCWMSNDAANHRVALLAVPGLEEPADRISETGMHHLAFEYDSVEDLLATYERLREDGIEPHACLDHGMTTSFYYVDPDGNSVELQADNFGDWDQSSEWMRTAPEFAADPIGVNLDPAAMLEASKAGADAQELHRRGYAGEFDPGTPLDLRLP